MRSPTIKHLNSVLAAVFIGLQVPLAVAAIVPTEDSAVTDQAQADREKVKAFLERATVQDRLQTMGVQLALAKDRVDALTDQEVATLAQKIDQMPAGGNLSTTDWILILLVAILVAIAI